jgi:hypothetical protein
VYSYPNASTGTAGPDVQNCPGHNAVLGGTALTGATYSWSPTTNLSNPLIANPTTTTTVTRTYTVTITDYCGNVSTDAVTVTWNSICVRRMGNPDSGEDSGISLYPNPAQGSFTINTNDANEKTIIVYDVTGKQIFQKETTEEQLQIDLGDAPKGLYLVKIISGGSVAVERVMNE